MSETKAVLAQGVVDGESFRLWVPDTTTSRDVVRDVLSGRDYQVFDFLNPVSVVLDIGANVGAASLLFHRYYPGAMIHAFEPQSSVFELLSRNMEGLEGVHCHPVGLSDRDGEVPFYLQRRDTVTGSIFRADASGDPVETVRLRDAAGVLGELGITDIDILKIDTEGCEVEILRSLGDRACGARAIYVEYHRESDRRWIDAFLADTHLLCAGRISFAHRGTLAYLNRNCLPAEALEEMGADPA